MSLQYFKAPKRNQQVNFSRLQQQARRLLRRLIATKSTRLMNDTKWREVFTIWNNRSDFRVAVARIKFIDWDEPFVVAGSFPIVHPTACDGFPGPFLFREIEWMEFPCVHDGRKNRDPYAPFECRQDVSAFLLEVRKLGKLPIEETDNGFRIVAYLT